MLRFQYFRQLFIRKTVPPELARAQQLIRALDRGGVPLNPAKINAIARVRACLQRARDAG